MEGHRVSQGPITFEEIIAPLSREQFFTQYWNRSFLHLRGPKGRFTPLLTWQMLNEVLEWQNPPPQIQLFREGNQIDPQVYIDHMDKLPEARRLNAGRLIVSLAQGASMIISGIQKNVPPVKALADEFERILEARNLVNLYAGWGTQNTFHLHWDAQEVFILQLSGRKHWKIYAPTRSYPLKDDEEETPQPAGPPVWEGVVEDGDMLYMPRGWWHIVRPLNEPSLHLNIGVEALTTVDFLGWWLPQLLRYPEVRQDVRPSDMASKGGAYFARLLEVMQRDGRGRNLFEEFARQWTAGRPPRPRFQLPQAPDDQRAPITAATRVRLAERGALVIKYKPGDRVARFQAVGSQYDASPQIIPALERLSGQTGKPVGELCSGIHDPQVIRDVFAALESLAGLGVILKE